METTLEASRESLVVTNIASHDMWHPVEVRFGGRTIATFEASRGDWDATTKILRLAWPDALKARLHGCCEVGVKIGSTSVSQIVQFGSTSAHLELLDPISGTPLVLNKWDRLAKSFQNSSEGFLGSLLDAVEQLIADVRDAVGLELFVVGGTLLGPIRDGMLMKRDDDADLAYLSSYNNPTDIVLEGFRLERALEGRGYELVRQTSGHLQIMFPGGTMSEHFYIDIFTYFIANDWFYGTFQSREPSSKVRIQPLSAVSVNGRLLPGPADPESLLQATYGSGWKIPDPTFKFVTPPAAGRRYYAWLNHFDVDRENWEDEHRRLIAVGAVPEPTSFAGAIEKELPAGAQLIELGSGLGADALYFAQSGHEVLATDYSRPALLHIASLATSGQLDTKVVNLYSMRHLSNLLATIDPERPAFIYAHAVLDAVHRLAWENVGPFLKHALSRGGKAFLQLSKIPQLHEDGVPMQQSGPVDLNDFRQLMTTFDLSVTLFDQGNDQGFDTTTVRLVVSRNR